MIVVNQYLMCILTDNQIQRTIWSGYWNCCLLPGLHGRGKDGGAAMAERFGLPLLGRIPLVESICESGDAGEPVALGSRPDAQAFITLAGNLAQILG